MKKFGKALALLAAGALLFGSVLSSCSSGSDDDDDDQIKVTAADNATSVVVGGTLQLTASTDGVAWESSDTAVATVDENGLVTGVAAGKATITASKDGFTSGAFEITVTAKGEEKKEEQEDEETTQLSVTWKFSEFASALNAPSGSSSALGEEKTCGIAVLGKNIKVRSDGDGVKGTITEGVAGYAQLSNGKDGAIKITLPAGTRKLVLGAKVTDTKILKVVAEDGETVLKEFSASSDSNYADYTYDCTYDAETVVYVGTFTASTTVNFKAFNVWTYAKKNAAPSADLFTANSTADGYSITVSAPAGIEYSTDNGENWQDATETITLTTYGTVLFRTKKTDDALASSTVSVTVEEYKDTSLPAADKPSADNFKAVPAANGSDGSISLNSADGIEYLNGETWEAAKTSYTGLAAGTYKFRTAAVAGTSNASDALEVVVGTCTLSVTAETEWDLKDYTTNALYSGIPVRTGSDNVAAAITVTQNDNDLTGYLGKGLYLVNGVAAEYVSGKGLGYSKWAGDTSTDEEKTANANVALPAIQSAAAIKGPFKVTVTSPTSNSARSLNFYVSSDASTLFDTVAYSKVLSGSDISYIYVGEDEVYVGLGTVSTDGKVYTNISKIVLTAGATIPDDEFPATAVAFSNDGIADNALTLSKAQAVEGYQLTTTLTPSYSTDKVTYSVSGDPDVSVSAEGKVTVDGTFTGTETVTVTAKARDGVTATLEVTVSASVPLTAESVVTVGLATEDDSTSIYTTGSTTLAATLDKDYTDENITYTWSVDGTEVSDVTTSTYTFTATGSGEKSITCKAKSNEVTTNASEAVKVTVSDNFTLSVTDTKTELGTALNSLKKKDALTDGTYDGLTIASAIRANKDTLLLELNKNDTKNQTDGALSFKVAAGKTITFSLASTGSSNSTKFTIDGATLASIDGTAVITDTIIQVSGSSDVAVVATTTVEATVTLKNNDSRGLRVSKIVVADTTTE